MQEGVDRVGATLDVDPALRRIERALVAVPADGGALPDRCVLELSSLLGADCFCAFRPLPGQGCSLDLAVFRGFPPGIDVAQRMEAALEVCAVLGAPAFDISDPAAPSSRPNQVVRPLAELPPASRLGARALLSGFGVDALDVMRVVVCDGPTFLAWVGVLRRAEFTEDERAAFAQVVPPLRRHLALALRLRQAELFEAGLGAALEALGEPAFLFRRDGRLVASNRAAGELDLAPAELRERLGRALSGSAAEWSVQHVGGGAEPEGYLVTRRCRGGRSRPLAAAARRWNLTRAEARVLAWLAQGRSNKEIAQALDCSVRTVEIHASAILRKAGCARRAVVVAELARMGDGA